MVSLFNILYFVAAGDTYNVLSIDSSTGEITIAQTFGNNLNIKIDSYAVVIGAYGKLKSKNKIIIYIAFWIFFLSLITYYDQEFIL